MKVRIEITIEVDTVAWIANYGTPAGDLRADVKAYAESLIVEQLRTVGVLA